MRSLFSCPVRPPVIEAAGQEPAALFKTAGERSERVLYKICRCGALIPQTMKCCEKCAQQEQSRHVRYNHTRRDQRAAEFYVSKEWRDLRPLIFSAFDYIDIYAMYVFDELVTLTDSDPIHHIVELEEDYSRRLDPFNLIPLGHDTHTTITALYKRDKATMRATQARIRQVILCHFKEAGGIEKVFSRLGLVPPPP